MNLCDLFAPVMGLIFYFQLIYLEEKSKWDYVTIKTHNKDVNNKNRVKCGWILLTYYDIFSLIKLLSGKYLDYIRVNKIVFSHSAIVFL